MSARIYALVDDGLVVDVIVTDSSRLAELQAAHDAVVDVSTVTTNPSIGWGWDGAQFIPTPVPVEPVPALVPVSVYRSTGPPPASGTLVDGDVVLDGTQIWVWRLTAGTLGEWVPVGTDAATLAGERVESGRVPVAVDDQDTVTVGPLAFGTAFARVPTVTVSTVGSSDPRMSVGVGAVTQRTVTFHVHNGTGAWWTGDLNWQAVGL